MIYRNYLKRLGDFTFASILFFLLFPIFIITSIILIIVNEGSPFFFQKRAGKNEKVFSIIKFKSMKDKKDANGVLLPNKDRVTSVGNFIRNTSIDEIPQLINVIKGDMSIVGPRPLLIRYLPYYTSEEQLRHTILPGITGLAQISGRNTLEWDKRLALDVAYVKNLSFSTDMKILFKTARKVLDRKDIVLDQTGVMLDLDELRKAI